MDFTDNDNELVNPGQENMFSFLLVWTLFYGAYALFPCSSAFR